MDPEREVNEERKLPRFGTRHLFVFLGFLGFVNVYAMRVNLSVAIVYMAEPAVFNWSEKEKGVILGMFFYGYVLTQLPGGRLAEIVGGKWLFGVDGWWHDSDS